MTSPEVCVLKTDGINCDYEMQHAFETAGARAELVHVNQLRSGERKLKEFGALAIPGGFSYGDDIASGKVLANELTSYMTEQLLEFTNDAKPIIGVCNGFQVLVRTGLLPERKLGAQTATLTQNNSGRFECRWIELKPEESVCLYFGPEDFDEQTIPMQIAHGEGRFLGDSGVVNKLEDTQQILFRYAPSPYVIEPYNPNGSVHDIAAVCDPTGLIVGLMPHPERSIEAFHPYRARTEIARTAAQIIFRNIVKYIKEL